MTAKEMFQKGEELLNSQKKEEATSYIIKSADMGYPLAQAVLGGFYMEGQGVPLDIDKGISLLEKSANQGCGVGERNLAISYYTGYGLTKNIKKAVEYYQRAADHGDIYAQHQLG